MDLLENIFRLDHRRTIIIKQAETAFRFFIFVPESQTLKESGQLCCVYKFCVPCRFTQQNQVSNTNRTTEKRDSESKRPRKSISNIVPLIVQGFYLIWNREKYATKYCTVRTF